MQKREKKLTPAASYLAKAKDLSKTDTEKLMSRMRGRFQRRYEDKRLDKIEVLALQLQHEDEQLIAWRKKVADLRVNS
jgi:hypothetical protein